MTSLGNQVPRCMENITQRLRSSRHCHMTVSIVITIVVERKEVSRSLHLRNNHREAPASAWRCGVVLMRGTRQLSK
jgi:hypothetical protein